MAGTVPTKYISLEKCFPMAVEKQWGCVELGKQAGVSTNVARLFLLNKAKKMEKASDAALLTLSSKVGAVFKGAARRQIRRLIRLESIPDDEWTLEDFKLEKHTLAMLRPLMEWGKMSASDPTPDDGVPQLSDGL